MRISVVATGIDAEAIAQPRPALSLISSRDGLAGTREASDSEPHGRRDEVLQVALRNLEEGQGGVPSAKAGWQIRRVR